MNAAFFEVFSAIIKLIFTDFHSLNEEFLSTKYGRNYVCPLHVLPIDSKNHSEQTSADIVLRNAARWC